MRTLVRAVFLYGTFSAHSPQDWNLRASICQIVVLVASSTPLWTEDLVDLAKFRINFLSQVGYTQNTMNLLGGSKPCIGSQRNA